MNGKHKSKVEITAVAAPCAQKGERNRSNGFLSAKSMPDKTSLCDSPSDPVHEMENESFRKAFEERAAAEWNSAFKRGLGAFALNKQTAGNVSVY